MTWKSFPYQQNGRFPDFAPHCTPPPSRCTASVTYLAECSTLTVTRSYRICTCFPFTRSRSEKMLHGGTVCSLVFLFLAGHSLPNDVIIHRCRRNDKQRSAFCRNSVNYTRENPVWRRGFSTAKKQPPTEVGGCIGKVFTFPVRSSRGYRAARSTSRTGSPWSGSSGCW